MLDTRKTKPSKNLWQQLKSSAFRDFMFAVILLAVELILALRYGLDTWRLGVAEHASEWLNAPLLAVQSMAFADVALIDGVFVLMLILAKYSGTASKSLKTRFFTSLGAVVMFVTMLLVALQRIEVVAAARVAGVILLAYVFSDVAIDAYQKMHQRLKRRRRQKIVSTWQERLRSAISAVSYALIAVTIGLVTASVMNLVHVVRDFSHDSKLKNTARSERGADTKNTAQITASADVQKHAVTRAERLAELQQFLARNPTASSAEAVTYARGRFAIAERTAYDDLSFARAELASQNGKS